MKPIKVFVVGIFFFAILFLFFRILLHNSRPPTNNNRQPTTDYRIPKTDNRQPTTNNRKHHNVPISHLLFVPYWSLTDSTDLSREKTSDMAKLDSTDYRLPITDNIPTNLIYFGLSPLINGSINTSDAGHLRLANFLNVVSRTKLLITDNRLLNAILTIRMLDPNINESILENTRAQSTLISETIQTAKDHRFNAILLDLEMSSTIPTDRLTEQITQFIAYYFQECKKNNLNFSIALYGDTLYRKRPYDIKTLSKYTDRVYIMAYDFHKAKGSPGPNFPLYGHEKYGYDLEKMVVDFLSFVPHQKITIVFGMFGHEWMVDEKKRPISPATALSLNEIKKNYLRSCDWQDCVIKRDDLSSETEINFVQSKIQNDFAYLYYHIVWFEDEQSVNKKIEYLTSKGISSFAYWAWGYY